MKKKKVALVLAVLFGASPALADAVLFCAKATIDSQGRVWWSPGSAKVYGTACDGASMPSLSHRFDTSRACWATVVATGGSSTIQWGADWQGGDLSGGPSSCPPGTVNHFSRFETLPAGATSSVGKALNDWLDGYTGPPTFYLGDVNGGSPDSPIVCEPGGGITYSYHIALAGFRAGAGDQTIGGWVIEDVEFAGPPSGCHPECQELDKGGPDTGVEGRTWSQVKQLMR